MATLLGSGYVMAWAQELHAVGNCRGLRYPVFVAAYSAVPWDCTQTSCSQVLQCVSLQTGTVIMMSPDMTLTVNQHLNGLHSLPKPGLEGTDMLLLDG